MVRLVLMVAMAALTSFGTTSPLLNKSAQRVNKMSRYKINVGNIEGPGFKHTCTTCSKPCICRDEDRISPSAKIVQRFEKLINKTSIIKDFFPKRRLELIWNVNYQLSIGSIHLKSQDEE